MAKETLLKLTQNILSAMDSDEVNSIGDTVEALQVAEVIRETYDDIVARLNIPGHQGLARLEGVADVNRPTFMRIPDNVSKVHWVKYEFNDESNYTALTQRDIYYLEPDEFLERSFRMADLDTNVETIQPNGISFYVGANEDPRYWTTFDNEYIVFDSYNADVESTMQESKSLIFADIDNPFEMEDDFIPNLDAKLFPMLLAEAKVTCFVNFKQTGNANESKKARRHLTKTQNDKWRASKVTHEGPDYSRRPALGRRVWRGRYL